MDFNSLNVWWHTGTESIRGKLQSELMEKWFKGIILKELYAKHIITTATLPRRLLARDYIILKFAKSYRKQIIRTLRKMLFKTRFFINLFQVFLRNYNWNLIW